MSKPFKMLGHELPGPNQRTSLKMLGQEMTRGTGLRADMESNIHSLIGGGMLDAAVRGQYVEDDTGMKRNQPAVEDDTVETFSGGVDGGHGPTSKKKVDVEVTVNGQKV